MEKKRKQRYQSDDGQQEKSSAETLDGSSDQGKEEVVPGVSIIRDSTPRPLSFDMMASYSGYFRSLQLEASSAFPEQAPSAPPLPEELGEHDGQDELNVGIAVPPTPQLLASEELDEQNTDPLPTVKDGPRVGDAFVQKSPIPLQTNWPLVIFSVYLAMLLLIVLTFAVLQGMGFGRHVLTNDFTPLEVPWLVIMYGLLGGCVSSLLSLRHLQTSHLPLFVIITWFIRPYIGAVLAIFAYLLLTSGVFIVGQNVERHLTFFWLVGALAGFSEGWLFFRHG